MGYKGLGGWSGGPWIPCPLLTSPVTTPNSLQQPNSPPLIMSFGLGRNEAKMAPISTNQGGNVLTRYIPKGKCSCSQTYFRVVFALGFRITESLAASHGKHVPRCEIMAVDYRAAVSKGLAGRTGTPDGVVEHVGGSGRLDVFIPPLLRRQAVVHRPGAPPWRGRPTRTREVSVCVEGVVRVDASPSSCSERKEYDALLLTPLLFHLFRRGAHPRLHRPCTRPAGQRFGPR